MSPTVAPDPKKPLNRQDLKVAKNPLSRTFNRETPQPILGAFSSFGCVPPDRPYLLAFLAPWRLRISDWGYFTCWDVEVGVGVGVEKRDWSLD